MLVKEYPNLKRADEIEGSKVLLNFAFNANTQANGWGAFDPAMWQEQIALYDELKQFTAGAPKLEDVITTKILEATKGAARQGRLRRAIGRIAPSGDVCERITVRFTTERGTVTALENIDLAIPRGSFLTLLGPSGCGKSTLLRVMADLIEPSGGRISVLGDAPATARLNREIGFVFQDAALLPWRTVLENVTLPLEVGGGKALPGARSPQDLLEPGRPHRLGEGLSA